MNFKTVLGVTCLRRDPLNYAMLEWTGDAVKRDANESIQSR